MQTSVTRREYVGEICPLDRGPEAVQRSVPVLVTIIIVCQSREEGSHGKITHGITNVCHEFCFHVNIFNLQRDGEGLLQRSRVVIADVA